MNSSIIFYIFNSLSLESFSRWFILLLWNLNFSHSISFDFYLYSNTDSYWFSESVVCFVAALLIMIRTISIWFYNFYICSSGLYLALNVMSNSVNSVFSSSILSLSLSARATTYDLALDIINFYLRSFYEAVSSSDGSPSYSKSLRLLSKTYDTDFFGFFGFLTS